MEDFLYAYNQPKQFGKYDLFLDGKITVNELIYKTLTEEGEYQNISIEEKVKEIESRLQTHFTFDDNYETYDNLQKAFEEGSLKETVIYIVKNENTSDNPDNNDMFNEYMIIGGKLELIGSGSYAKQQADLNKEIEDRIADVNAEESRATEKEGDIITKLTTITGYEFDEDLTSHDGNIDSRIKKEVTDRTNADTVLDEKITAEKERAIKAENELSTYIKKEEEIRTSQINGLNQEAKQNRNRIEQLESKVSIEITRATEAENELSARIKTIEDYDINTRVNEIEVEVSRAKEAEEALQSQITTLESIVGSLQKAVVVLELPNYSINKSSTFTDTQGDNQSYTVLLDMPKGSLIKGNNTTEVKINDETIGDFIFNIDDLGTITSNQQQFSYKLSDEIITTSTTDEGVLQDDGSTIITTTTTTTTTPRQLLITISISGTHKESTLDIDFSVEKLIDQTHTETTTSTETIPPSTEITE